MINNAILRLLPPSYYYRQNVYEPERHIAVDVIRDAAMECRKHYGITSADGGPGINVISIDFEDGFCREWGGLYVGMNPEGGPLADAIRFAEFKYSYAAIINTMISTEDAHFPYMITCPAGHLGRDGKFAPPNIDITAEMIKRGDYRPNPDLVKMLAGGRDYRWLQDYVLYYAETLERTRNFPLHVWSEHCPNGGPGQSLVNILHDARIFVSYLRGINPITHFKGRALLTEEYSPFEPEVIVDHQGRPLAESDSNLAKDLADNEAILDHMFRLKGPKVFAGQAKGFCFSAGVDTWLKRAGERDPSQIGQTYILEDCSSPVVIRGADGQVIVDFTARADADMARFQEMGAHVVKSTTPIEEWPDIRLAA